MYAHFCKLKAAKQQDTSYHMLAKYYSSCLTLMPSCNFSCCNDWNVLLYTNPDTEDISYIDTDPHVVQLVDCFDHIGPHGVHVCMVFEMLGCNLLSVIKRYDYRGIPLPIVRRLVCPI
jgi:hypothetical protein